ncbi:hypothetical protein Scep_026476 [Stephania cephalantha]|uniref:Plastid lipid-associated protein/fibrillin conserved domain-containing protein n=1 Tax=Stephania cephalantha TaxID=152367 RepID=A0AAP0HS35_9MAGN
MAIGIMQPPITTCHLGPATPKSTKLIRTPIVASSSLTIKTSGFGDHIAELRNVHIMKAAEQSSSLVSNDPVEQGAKYAEYQTVAQIKETLYQAIEGINRGIFGVPSAKKSEILGLIELLESQNPTPNPTENLDKVEGSWKVLYSTISILGAKRTKLGLRDFIALGDFLQSIDVAKGKAVNVIQFNARGLTMLNGQLTIETSFKISSKSRVNIKYANSTITPDQLMNVFQKNYDLLLSIFNPEGWLEITYVDETTRIGRDDKGGIFILERLEHGA